MQPKNMYMNSNKIPIVICENCGQSIVAYKDNTKKKDWKVWYCDNCQKTFNIKITTYNRINKKMQPAAQVLRRCSLDALL